MATFFCEEAFGKSGGLEECEMWERRSRMDPIAATLRGSEFREGWLVIDDISPPGLGCVANKGLETLHFWKCGK